MSQKIPFLQMFSALRRWSELAQAVEGWVIVTAAIDKASRSARIQAEGAAGAGPNLIREAEEAVCRAYGLNAVRIEPAPDSSPAPAPAPAETAKAAPAEQAQPAAAPAREPQDAVARAEAIRKAAMKQAAHPVKPKGDKKPAGRPIFGKSISKAPTPIGELELDMGMVVVEGDVFAVDNRELKKRGAWVVAFDITDYTGSIRVNKFFPGDEGKPLVDAVRKGLHLKVQGRLNMDRFYGDMVLEPVAVMAADKPMKQDTAPEKRVELHLGGGAQAGPGQERDQTGGGLGPPGHRHHRPRGGPGLPRCLALGQKDQAALRGGGLLPQRRG